MRRRISIHKELEPDEIFLDSTNLPSFEKERLEGRLEQPFSRRTFWYLSAFLVMIFMGLWFKAFKLEAVDGKEFSLRADQNRLRVRPLWPSRGLIFDRTGQIVAQNKSSFRVVQEEDRSNVILGVYNDWLEAQKISRGSSAGNFVSVIEPFYSRRYPLFENLAHLLGYVGYPSEEDSKREVLGKWQTLIGKTGVEEKYEKELRGAVGTKLTEVNSKGETSSEAVEEPPQNGRDV